MIVTVDRHLSVVRSRPPPAPSHHAAGFAATAFALLALLGFMLLAALVWLHGAGGRAFVARHVESAVTAQIRGELRVASVEAISRHGLRARGLRFIAPNGDVVITADAAVVDVRWSSLLRGRFVSPHATVTGGRVLLHDDAAGELSIDTATSSRSPGGSGAPATGNEATLDLQHIDVEGITLVTSIHGIPAAHVTGIRGALQIVVREPRGDLRLSLTQLAASARIATPAPIALRLTGGTFVFDGGSMDRFRADVGGVLGGDRVRLHCTGHVRDDAMNVSLRLALPRGAGPLDNVVTRTQLRAAALTSQHFAFGVTRD